MKRNIYYKTRFRGGSLTVFGAELYVVFPRRTKAPEKPAAFRRLRLAWDGEKWLSE